jgi:class 3 adenylate cyclase
VENAAGDSSRRTRVSTTNQRPALRDVRDSSIVVASHGPTPPRGPAAARPTPPHAATVGGSPGSAATSMSVPPQRGLVHSGMGARRPFQETHLYRVLAEAEISSATGRRERKGELEAIDSRGKFSHAANETALKDTSGRIRELTMIDGLLPGAEQEAFLAMVAGKQPPPAPPKKVDKPGKRRPRVGGDEHPPSSRHGSSQERLLKRLTTRHNIDWSEPSEQLEAASSFPKPARSHTAQPGELQSHAAFESGRLRSPDWKAPVRRRSQPQATSPSQQRDIAANRSLTPDGTHRPLREFLPPDGVKPGERPPDMPSSPRDPFLAAPSAGDLTSDALHLPEGTAHSEGQSPSHGPERASEDSVWDTTEDGMSRPSSSAAAAVQGGASALERPSSSFAVAAAVQGGASGLTPLRIGRPMNDDVDVTSTAPEAPPPNKAPLCVDTRMPQVEPTEHEEEEEHEHERGVVVMPERQRPRDRLPCCAEISFQFSQCLASRIPRERYPLPWRDRLEFIPPWWGWLPQCILRLGRMEETKEEAFSGYRAWKTFVSLWTDVVKLGSAVGVLITAQVVAAMVSGRTVTTSSIGWVAVSVLACVLVLSSLLWIVRTPKHLEWAGPRIRHVLDVLAFSSQLVIAVTAFAALHVMSYADAEPVGCYVQDTASGLYAPLPMTTTMPGVSYWNCERLFEPVAVFLIGCAAFYTSTLTIEFISHGIIAGGAVAYSYWRIWGVQDAVCCIPMHNVVDGTVSIHVDPTGIVAATMWLAMLWILLGVSAGFRESTERHNFIFASLTVKTQKDMEGAIHNLFPTPIALAVKQGKPVRAVRHKNVAVIWCDLAGFTELSRTMSPDDLLELLSKVYSAFEGICESNDVIKVDTIGDAFVGVSGIFEDEHGRPLTDAEALGIESESDADDSDSSEEEETHVVEYTAQNEPILVPTDAISLGEGLRRKVVTRPGETALVEESEESDEDQGAGVGIGGTKHRGFRTRLAQSSPRSEDEGFSPTRGVGTSVQSPTSGPPGSSSSRAGTGRRGLSEGDRSPEHPGDNQSVVDDDGAGSVIARPESKRSLQRATSRDTAVSSVAGRPRKGNHRRQQSKTRPPEAHSPSGGSTFGLLSEQAQGDLSALDAVAMITNRGRSNSKGSRGSFRPPSVQRGTSRDETGSVATNARAMPSSPARSVSPRGLLPSPSPGHQVIGVTKSRDGFSGRTHQVSVYEDVQEDDTAEDTASDTENAPVETALGPRPIAARRTTEGGVPDEELSSTASEDTDAEPALPQVSPGVAEATRTSPGVSPGGGDKTSSGVPVMDAFSAVSPVSASKPPTSPNKGVRRLNRVAPSPEMTGNRGLVESLEAITPLSNQSSSAQSRAEDGTVRGRSVLIRRQSPDQTVEQIFNPPQINTVFGIARSEKSPGGNQEESQGLNAQEWSHGAAVSGRAKGVEQQTASQTDRAPPSNRGISSWLGFGNRTSDAPEITPVAPSSPLGSRWTVTRHHRSPSDGARKVAPIAPPVREGRAGIVADASKVHRERVRQSLSGDPLRAITARARGVSHTEHDETETGSATGGDASPRAIQQQGSPRALPQGTSSDQASVHGGETPQHRSSDESHVQGSFAPTATAESLGHVEADGPRFGDTAGVTAGVEVAERMEMSPEARAQKKARIRSARMRRALERVFLVGKMMQRALDAVCEDEGRPGMLRMRIGIHVGDVVTALIGRKSPRWHVFGPAVVKAEQMESTGVEGAVHCSVEAASAYTYLPFIFEEHLIPPPKAKSKTSTDDIPEAAWRRAEAMPKSQHAKVRPTRGYFVHMEANEHLTGGLSPVALGRPVIARHMLDPSSPGAVRPGSVNAPFEDSLPRGPLFTSGTLGASPDSIVPNPPPPPPRVVHPPMRGVARASPFPVQSESDTTSSSTPPSQGLIRSVRSGTRVVRHMPHAVSVGTDETSSGSSHNVHAISSEGNTSSSALQTVSDITVSQHARDSLALSNMDRQTPSSSSGDGRSREDVHLVSRHGDVLGSGASPRHRPTVADREDGVVTGVPRSPRHIDREDGVVTGVLRSPRHIDREDGVVTGVLRSPRHIDREDGVVTGVPRSPRHIDRRDGLPSPLEASPFSPKSASSPSSKKGTLFEKGMSDPALMEGGTSLTSPSGGSVRWASSPSDSPVAAARSPPAASSSSDSPVAAARSPPAASTNNASMPSLHPIGMAHERRNNASLGNLLPKDEAPLVESPSPSSGSGSRASSRPTPQGAMSRNASNKTQDPQAGANSVGQEASPSMAGPRSIVSSLADAMV